MREKHTIVVWNGYTFEVSLETDVQYEDVIVTGIELKGKTAFPVRDVEIDFHELSAELYVKIATPTDKPGTYNIRHISLEEHLRELAIEAMRE